ncbi:MAG TPA: DUF6582 domain-containing protein [Ktedonobacterales bacterium]
MSDNKTDTTWEPPKQNESGRLSTEERNELPSSAFAFPKERKEPLTSASHVKDALARFDLVKDVDPQQRDLAWRNILKAAKHYGIDVEEANWHELGSHPHTPNPAH